MVAVDLDVYGSHAAGMSEADDRLTLFRLNKIIDDRSRKKYRSSCSDGNRDRICLVKGADRYCTDADVHRVSRCQISVHVFIILRLRDDGNLRQGC